MLLCLYRLCLSRRACTWVAYVNLNIKRNDDDDDDDVNVVFKEGDHLLICFTIARISLMVIISLRRRTTGIWPTLFLQSELTNHAIRLLVLWRCYVTDDCFRRLVVSLFHSRLDFGNFILVGLPPIFSDNSSLCSTLQLVWCSGFDPATTSVMPLQSFSGCVYHNVSTTKLRSWHFAVTIHISTSLFTPVI